MTEKWEAGAPGVIELPSGRRFRGRGLKRDSPEGPSPTFAVHLTGSPTEDPPWERQWVRWPDFWLPSDPDEATRALRQAYDRAHDDRVEIACGGGIGRTGTGLATMCVLDGMEPDAAVDWVRERYHKRAVEVRWQRRFLRRVWSGSTSSQGR